MWCEMRSFQLLFGAVWFMMASQGMAAKNEKSTCPNLLINRVTDAFKALASKLRSAGKIGNMHGKVTLSAKLSVVPSEATIRDAIACDAHGQFKETQITRESGGLKIDFEAALRAYCTYYKMNGPNNRTMTGAMENVALSIVGSNGKFSATLEAAKKGDYKVPKKDCLRQRKHIRAKLLAKFADVIKDIFENYKVFSIAVCPAKMRNTIRGFFDGFSADGIELPRDSIPKFSDVPVITTLRYKLQPALQKDAIDAALACRRVGNQISFMGLSIRQTDLKLTVEGSPNKKFCKDDGKYSGKVELSSISVNFDEAVTGTVVQRDASAEDSAVCPNLPVNKLNAAMLGHWKEFLEAKFIYMVSQENCDETALKEMSAAFDQLFLDGFEFSGGAGLASFPKDLTARSAMVFGCSMGTKNSAVKGGLTIRSLPVNLRMTLPDGKCTGQNAMQTETTTFETRFDVGTEASNVKVVVPEAAEEAQEGECAPLTDRIQTSVRNAFRNAIRQTVSEWLYFKGRPLCPKKIADKVLAAFTKTASDTDKKSEGNANTITFSGISKETHDLRCDSKTKSKVVTFALRDESMQVEAQFPSTSVTATCKVPTPTACATIKKEDKQYCEAPCKKETTTTTDCSDHWPKINGKQYSCSYNDKKNCCDCDFDDVDLIGTVVPGLDWARGSCLTGDYIKDTVKFKSCVEAMPGATVLMPTEQQLTRMMTGKMLVRFNVDVTNLGNLGSTKLTDAQLAEKQEPFFDDTCAESFTTAAKRVFKDALIKRVSDIMEQFKYGT